MDAHDRHRLEDLKSQVSCSKNFACVSSKFKNLCKARYLRESSDLECLEEGPVPCEFSIHQDGRKICSCDLRLYIEKNLDKWIETSTAY
jgi:hypothetical protein